jgi:protein-tyrosine-phosphatase
MPMSDSPRPFNVLFLCTGNSARSIMAESIRRQVGQGLTVCDNAAGEVCPVWPGQSTTAHWGIPDPAAVEGSDEVKHGAFADACRLLLTRIRLLTSLPLANLDRLSLQNKLREIGKS